MGCIVINIFNRYHRFEITDETVTENTPVQSEPVKLEKTRKRKVPEVSESVKNMFRDSLDNERVKQQYKLTPKE